jgi:hypothetical protein
MRPIPLPPANLVGPDSGAISGAQTLINIINLITDRTQLIADPTRYADVLREAKDPIDEVKKCELLHREREATKPSRNPSWLCLQCRALWPSRDADEVAAKPMALGDTPTTMGVPGWLVEVRIGVSRLAPPVT